MKKTFPSPDEVREALKPLSAAGLRDLAEVSKVPFHTLLKIRDGDTTNPRLGTVLQFWRHLPQQREARAA